MPRASKAYEGLRDFIQRQMRMAHIYHPVTLRELLKRRCKAKIPAIAKALLSRDRSQIEYYEAIAKNMVGEGLYIHRRILCFGTVSVGAPSVATVNNGGGCCVTVSKVSQ